MSRSWDVFCRVIDNYGDAAVCWRLARELANEHGGRVRLWVDELPALHALCPQVDPSLSRQAIEGVEICAWSTDAQFGGPAEVVVEAFGCGLPEAYVESMAARPRAPLWIVLEYLSAEPWVTTHHMLPSPHPRLPLQRHFFFPGVVQGTGGVLRESTLEPRRLAFESKPDARAQFWQRLGFAPPDGRDLVVSLFGYENPAAGALLEAWSGGEQRVVVAVPGGRLRPQVSAYFGTPDPGDGQTLRQGRLEARFLPFLPQAGYDELLWACDWNFVRGEDSFVRAQWACRPFTWHIYPQADSAHETKLRAFLDLYCEGLGPALAGDLRAFWAAWNGGREPSNLPAAWKALCAGLPELKRHAESWAEKLALPGELAANLAHYCKSD